ncbi:MAG: hypothetical protein ACD_21C00201G0003 [uncultured bacterium]|nr:MAG: hypothetical protein ACD_21C00201G0003 [uncultured bacterium]
MFKNILRIIICGFILHIASGAYAVKLEITEGLKASHEVPETEHEGKNDIVVLQVYIDDIPYCFRFLSGNNKKLDRDVCPKKMFATAAGCSDEDAFLNGAAGLLKTDDWKMFDKFNIDFMLRRAWLQQVDKLKNSDECLRVLNSTWSIAEASRKQACGKTITPETIDDLARTLKEYLGNKDHYLKLRGLINFWSNTYELFNQKGGICEPAVKNYDERIKESFVNCPAQQIGCEESESGTPSDPEELARYEFKLGMWLLEKSSGQHAEDAVIFSILSDIESGDIKKQIKTIEIYGSKDPCFVCQVKLQHLANTLNRRIQAKNPESNTENTKLTIYYYSNRQCKMHCWVKLEGNRNSKYGVEFTTRPDIYNYRLAKFTFEQLDDGKEKADGGKAPPIVEEEKPEAVKGTDETQAVTTEAKEQESKIKDGDNFYSNDPVAIAFDIDPSSKK